MTEELRERMAAELDTLTMPDLVPGVLREGRRVVRRRRLATGSLLAVGALGGGSYLLTSGPAGDSAHYATDTTVRPTPTPSTSPTAVVDAAADDWAMMVENALSSLIADTPVDGIRRDPVDAGFDFILTAPAGELRLNLNVRPGDVAGDCADVAAKPGQPAPTCVSRPAGSATTAVLFRDVDVTSVTLADERGATTANLMWADFRQQQSPLTDDQLLDWMTSPLVRALIDYAYDHAKELEGVAVFTSDSACAIQQAEPNSGSESKTLQPAPCG